MNAGLDWLRDAPETMSDAQWESLCDRCGKCCLHKLENADSGEVFYTEVACRLYDSDNARCSDYANRASEVPNCLVMPRQLNRVAAWLPDSCAYRRIAEQRPLPEWHPLLTGDYNSVQQAGQGIAGRCVSERDVPEPGEEHIIHWITM